MPSDTDWDTSTVATASLTIYNCVVAGGYDAMHMYDAASRSETTRK